MRVREWYGYHFPELVKLVNDNYQYCQLVKLIKNRKCLTAVTDEMLEGIEKIVMDSAKSQAICDCARASMGMDISDFDLINIEIFANKGMFKSRSNRFLIFRTPYFVTDLLQMLDFEHIIRLLVWQIIVKSSKVIFPIRWELLHHHLHLLSVMLLVLD